MDDFRQSTVKYLLHAVREELKSGSVIIPDDYDPSNQRVCLWNDIRGLIWAKCAEEWSHRERTEFIKSISTIVRASLGIGNVWDITKENLEYAELITLAVFALINYFKPLREKGPDSNA